MKKKVLLVLLIVCVILTGCKKKDDKKEEAKLPITLNYKYKTVTSVGSCSGGSEDYTYVIFRDDSTIDIMLGNCMEIYESEGTYKIVDDKVVLNVPEYEKEVIYDIKGNSLIFNKDLSDYGYEDLFTTIYELDKSEEIPRREKYEIPEDQIIKKYIATKGEYYSEMSITLLKDNKAVIVTNGCDHFYLHETTYTQEGNKLYIKNINTDEETGFFYYDPKGKVLNTIPFTIDGNKLKLDLEMKYNYSCGYATLYEESN